MSDNMRVYMIGLVVGIVITKWDRWIARKYQSWLRRQAWYRNLKARREP
jgi:hypothetical protein